MRRKIVFVLKVIFSGGLLGYLLVSADFERLNSRLLEVDLYFYAAALTVSIVAVVVSAYKWQALLAASGIFCGVWLLVRYYLIGIYFNNFLPTSFGGDAARIYLLSKKNGNRVLVALSVFLERFSGLLFLVVFLLLGMLAGPRILEPRVAMFVVLACCFVLLASGLFLFSKVRRWLLQLLPTGISAKLKILDEGGLIDFRSRQTTWNVIWTSLVFNFLNVFTYVLVARALSIPLSFLDLLVVVPLVTLLTMLPLSLNGLGLREGGFVFLLARLQVSQADALSLSLLFYTIPILLSIAGGVFFLFSKSENGGPFNFENGHD